MFSPFMRLPLAAVLIAASLARAEEPKWDVLVKGPPLTVKNRPIAGTGIREFWAEGEIDAPPLAVEQALSDTEHLKDFMPHLVSSKEISAKESDGSVYVYTVIDIPVMGKRDYVVKVATKESLKADGTGRFQNEWHAEPTKLPEKPGIVRIKLNDGGWTVTPVAEGKKSYVIYRFATDPGGAIPQFAANMGSQSAAKDTWAAVTKEAQRIAREKK